MFAGDALPGIRVDLAPAPLAEALPRMDVAVFAGFAERGPCHRAIAISSVAAYEAVFGGDCPLAWDARAGAQLTGQLAASVRGFFSNGGKRCWAIRLAETDAVLAARAALGIVDPDARPAVAGSFLMPGILRRLPVPEGDASFVESATLAAASLGAWSDAMRLVARVSRTPVALAAAQKVRHGLRFADQGVLAPGELIEVRGGDGHVTRYAKVLRIEAGTVLAMWIASFARLRDPQGGAPAQVNHGQARIGGEIGSFGAKLTEGAVSTAKLPLEAAPLLRRGRWMHFTEEGEAIWLRIDAVDTGIDKVAVQGPAWRQIASRLPSAPVAAARVTIDIAELRPGANRVQAGLAPAPEGVNALQAIRDADLFHADPANRTATIRPAFAVTRAETRLIAAGYGATTSFADIAARFATPAFTAADRIALRSAWLPIGLDASFGEPAEPIPQTADPIERNGLSRFDERLFLDPRLADLHGGALSQQAAAVRDLGEEQLFGIHAALDIAGDLFPEPSLIAVPDAAQPGWKIGAAGDAVLPPRAGAPVNANWRNHAGGCPLADAPKPSAPDAGVFLDSSTRMLPAPELNAPPNPVATDSFTLSWGPQPDGSVVVLEEAWQPDFSDAVEILRDSGVEELTLGDRAQGTHYYRLHIALDGNVSAYASRAVVLRKSSYAAIAPDSAVLARIQIATLRMAAANGDFFALLSLPRSFRASAAAAHATLLATPAPGAGSPGQLGSDETRLLSFGALYHPWLVSRGASGLVSAPPDGAVAGAVAARAQARGAWIAPANDPLADVVGLDPALPEGDLLGLDRARVNMVRRLPTGFALRDADTLCPERDWRPIHVRRLMMLLRRTLFRRGMAHVFEPNSAVLRRAVERSLTTTLDDLQQRGAFSNGGYRLAVQASAGSSGDRLVVEIGVSPAQPIRFLTLRLVQQGGRLSLVEAA